MRVPLTAPRSSLLLLAAWRLYKGVSAQTTEVVCNNNFSWASNTRNQNPCQVAAYLQGACGSGQWTVPTLEAGAHYKPPAANETNPCACSSVVYNLLSCCALCQDREVINWGNWIMSCDQSLITLGYPRVIPPGTRVPGWAYIFNNTPDYIFTVEQALTSSYPEQPIEDPAISSSSRRPTASLTPSSSSVPNASTTRARPSYERSPPMAPIAMAVGRAFIGIAFIAICTGLFIWARKRRKWKEQERNYRSSVNEDYIPLESTPWSPEESQFDSSTVLPTRSNTYSRLDLAYPTSSLQTEERHSGPASLYFEGFPWLEDRAARTSEAPSRPGVHRSNTEEYTRLPQ